MRVHVNSIVDINGIILEPERRRRLCVLGRLACAKFFDSIGGIVPVTAACHQITSIFSHLTEVRGVRTSIHRLTPWFGSESTAHSILSSLQFVLALRAQTYGASGRQIHCAAAHG